MMRNPDTDGPSGPEAYTADYEAGDRSEILDRLMQRKKNLKFRHTVLVKRQQLRTKLPGAREEPEEEEQINELAAITREFKDLTTKQRELGYYEDDEDFMMPQGAWIPQLPDIPVTEEISHWPPPPPSEKLSDIPIPVDKLDMEPAVTQCPGCGEVVTTEIVKRIGHAAWIICFLSSTLGCVGGCCLIPFCLDSLKDVHHSCPKCRTKIFKREKI